MLPLYSQSVIKAHNSMICVTRPDQSLSVPRSGPLYVATTFKSSLLFKQLGYCTQIHDSISDHFSKESQVNFLETSYFNDHINVIHFYVYPSVHVSRTRCSFCKFVYGMALEFQQPQQDLV